MGHSTLATRRRTRPARQGRLKSVTYTGCWTCRIRKVKCDERHRNGCATCERTGVECQGYGVNLCWVTGKKGDPTGRRRRQIKLDQPSLLYIPDEEIDFMLSSLETVSSPVSTVTAGPFAIFQTQGYLSGSSKSECSRDNRMTGDEFEHAKAPPENFIEPVNGEDDQPQINSSSPESRAQLNLSKRFYSETSQLPWEFQEQSSLNLSMATLPADIDDGFANDEPFTPLIDPSLSFLMPLSLHLERSMPLFNDCDTFMLMHHYMNHVAELLQPVLHPQNPWRTTYFRLALEGSAETASPQTSISLSTAKVSTAVFHGVLSSAAFHLRNATINSTKYHKLGLQHRAKALQALHAALALPQDTQLYTVYLTAMLSLVTIDTMTGEDSDFPIHLDGCRRLQKPQTVPGINETSQVNSICHFLTLLARTTSFKSPRPWPTDQPPYEEPYFHPNDRSIEYIYGITPTLGNLLQRTCHLAEYIAFYKHPNIPPPLHEACTALKTSLLFWKPKPGEFHILASEPMIQIARCQAHAFHSAVLIFFTRAIGMNCTPDLDAEVTSILRNLTRAEDLKDEYMAGEKRTAPMSWPAFVAACEARDREPWVKWWERVRGYNLGNFGRQWRVVRELWAVMDQDRTVRSWWDALGKSGMLVLPI